MERGDDNKPVLVGVVQLRSAAGWIFKPTSDQDPQEIAEKDIDDWIPPEGSRFLRFVRKPWDIRSDISTEAWIAQEDLWIQNEIYRMVRVANDSVSVFERVKGDDKSGVAEYRNPYFHLAMQISDAKTLQVTITNLLGRRQKLEGMKLRVRFKVDKGNDEISELNVVTDSKYGDPLEPRGDPKKNDVRTIPIALPPAARKAVVAVEQMLTWETAAIKRIDHIAIGSAVGEDMSFGHRTVPLPLLPFGGKVEKKEEAGEKPGGQGPGPGGLGKVPGGFGGEKNVAEKALANGLLPDRYQEWTPQFRRIPVAIALIADQDHVDRVQTAFNNSRLRFLMTQVLLNHYPKTLRPDVTVDKAEDDAPKKGGGPPMPPGGLGMPPGGLGVPPGGGPAPAAAQAAVSDELEANMEMILYGVVTLYERFPPRTNMPGEVKAP
jgi:hypothetical protein